MQPGVFGARLLIVGIVASLFTIGGYVAALCKPQSRKALFFGRISYAVTALSALGTFATLIALVAGKNYRYEYVLNHTSNDMTGWWGRIAATWAGQEGSFLLWASWTALLGFLVLWKAGKYEARVMPIYVTILAFLCGILIKQSPFILTLTKYPLLHAIPTDGAGLNASLQNYWMRIHPPTIFFGFASLAVPFCYAVAALLWKDYDGWVRRVQPYALLSTGFLGLGLFMGGYWAYETQGWHGFWGWDPVENASFFPWLAVTALTHGLVAQRSRGGMARTNTFLGILPFSLFLVGTYLTRSGALAEKDASGALMSVHAFDNISKSGLILMLAMLLVYGVGGVILWAVRAPKMPSRKTTGDTMLSRDFGFFMAILLMMIACAVITLGTTTPLFMSWAHRPPTQPKPDFYNRFMMPAAILTALLLGCVPWLAWRKTDSETFLRKLLAPWFAMLVFGFFMLFWVQGAQREMAASADPNAIETIGTMKAWVNPTVQRVLVIVVTSLGVFAALSNAALAFRVFRSKPLSAGGWIAHVGIGVLIVGAVVSNTFERTERVLVREGQPPVEAFGYKIAFEKMTGKSPEVRPFHPDYDRKNTIALRVTPPGADESATVGAEDKTFLVEPEWFVDKFGPVEEKSDDPNLNNQTMRWPYIKRFAGHDLYIGLANDAFYEWPTDDPNRQKNGITLMPKEKRRIGPYTIGYFEPMMEPGNFMAAHVFIVGADEKPIEAMPALKFVTLPGSDAPPILRDMDNAIPQLPDADGNPGAIYLDNLDPRTKAATLRVSLPGYSGRWAVPLEVTFKPWVNLVWTGVLIAVAGTLLAMTRRAFEARTATDSEPVEAGKEPLEKPEERIPVGAAETQAKAGKKKPVPARAATLKSRP